MAHTSLDYIGIFLTQFYTHNCILTGKGEFIQFLLKERVLLIGNLKTASQKQEIILTATDLTMSYINVRQIFKACHVGAMPNDWPAQSLHLS